MALTKSGSLNVRALAPREEIQPNLCLGWYRLGSTRVENVSSLRSRLFLVKESHEVITRNLN